MPEERTLPIPAEHRELTVKVSGKAVSREQQLRAATVSKTVNRIAWARLEYLDGAAASSDFPLSNADTFVPGAEVEILAGAVNNPGSVFKGVVVRQSIKIREAGASVLVVECRHKAHKLTVGRKSVCHFDKPDSDILTAILKAASIDADVEATSVTHAQQVQYRATDWDFLLTRAEANGKLVFTLGDRVIVKAPTFDAQPVFKLHFGSTILEMDAEIDARLSLTAVKGRTWDFAQQAVVERESQDPGVMGPGNLTPGALAAVVGLDALDLPHASLTEDEAQAWADAEQLKSRMSQVSGRVKCEGIAPVEPGDRVTLKGVGQRFSGDVYLTGVRHEFDTTQGWKTHLQFGSTDGWLAERHPVTAPVAGALLPGVHGLLIGKVTSNEDGDGEHRVRVELPLVNDSAEGVWARVASLDAGKDRGFFFRPEVGDEVVVGFLDADPRRAVILGMLHSSAKSAPIEGSDDNHEKVYQSRSKMKWYLHDDKKLMRFETPAGNSISLSEEDKAVRIQDQSGNKIEMTDSGITVQSAKALTLKAGTEVSIEAGTSLVIKAGSSLGIEGASGVELKSAGTATIKGSIIYLN